MKKNILYTMLGCAFFASCSDDNISPNIDTSPEYQSVLTLNENSIHADTIIYEWYQKYHTAVLYQYEDKDLTWQWASKLTNYYEKFDISNKEDSAAVETVVSYIQTELFDKYADDFLAERLPYKMMLTKELHSGSLTTSEYVNVITNNQDAMIVGYLANADAPFTKSKFQENLTTVFTQLFFSALDPEPTEFLTPLVLCWHDMTTFPLLPGKTGIRDTDPEIEAEQETYPDFVDSDDYQARQLHSTNVVGYIKGGKNAITVPEKGQDYADYLDFIGNNPGSYIRQRTQCYWRIAKRASLLIEYERTYQNNDLIAKQNEKFPNDKVTMEDFSYPEN